MVRADAMAKSMHSQYGASFWENVSKIYKKVMPVANVVNCDNNPPSLSDVWKVSSVTYNANMKHGKTCLLNQNNVLGYADFVDMHSVSK